MSKKCQITNKKANNAYAISHSHIRTKKLQHINLQNKRIWSDTRSCWIRMRISAKAIKNITKVSI